ncbi:MAG: hypothetical protein G01um101416_839 [Microgenomates group bacterium Gr01-1014_16]|nr:MAG: hypothetical protein G01um101416_839 [Microgenomates group bacterium Gr01-1014_16]
MNARRNRKIADLGKSGLAINQVVRKLVEQLMGNLNDFCLREKIRSETFFLPYRKPTLVGRSRRPRRSGEGSSRNSAKKLDVSL